MKKKPKSTSKFFFHQLYSSETSLSFLFLTSSSELFFQFLFSSYILFYHCNVRLLSNSACVNVQFEILDLDFKLTDSRFNIVCGLLCSSKSSLFLLADLQF